MGNAVFLLTLVPRTAIGTPLIALFLLLPAFGQWYLILLTVLSFLYWTWTMLALFGITYRLYNLRNILGILGITFKTTEAADKFKVTIVRYLDHETGLTLAHWMVFVVINIVWPVQVSNLSTDTSDAAAVASMLYDAWFFTITLWEHGFAQFQATGRIAMFFSRTHMWTSLFYYAIILSTFAAVFLKKIVEKVVKKLVQPKPQP